jgi:dTDP-4-dehydrorhamnose 3,5-epimerase
VKFTKTNIEGIYIIEQAIHSDCRGVFIKQYNENEFLNAGLEFELSEFFLSESVENVIRGMHFQIPPYDHNKITSVIAGEILDVVLDLRKKSSTYGEFNSFTLSRENRKSIYIPKGCAHGFMSLSEFSIVSYMTSSIYSSTHDKGIRWDSFGFNWPENDAILLSERDKNFPKFNEYKTQF